MAPKFPLVVSGIHIRTSEALYQACRFPHLPDVQRIIIREHSPMTAKMRAKPHSESSRPDWFNVRVAIMRWCLRVKLSQNPSTFSDLLDSTGDLSIVEKKVRRSDFWGAKLDERGLLVGANVLGRLLMELRLELRSNGIDYFREIAPPSIDRFDLYGEPIGIVRMREDSPLATEGASLFRFHSDGQVARHRH